jgi:hypothetical protein
MPSSMSGAWGQGSTEAWRKARRFVLEGDGYAASSHSPAAPPLHAMYTTSSAAASAATTGNYLVAACLVCDPAAGDVRAHEPPLGSATRW